MEIEGNALPLVQVPGGTFKFAEDHPRFDNLEKWDKRGFVTETNVSDFEIGTYLVTFDDYDEYCLDVGVEFPNDQGWGRGKRPVINISWLEGTEYCNWLSEKYGYDAVFSDGDVVYKEESGGKLVKVSPSVKKMTTSILRKTNGFRYPSEEEWEYAAKGGRAHDKFVYIGSDDVNEVGWYKENTVFRTMEVGKLKPNSLGIYDMPGNVFEFCINGKNTIRGVRGGGWSSRAESMRATYSNGCRYDENHSYLGFRICRTTPQ